MSYEIRAKQFESEVAFGTAMQLRSVIKCIYGNKGGLCHPTYFGFLRETNTHQYSKRTLITAGRLKQHVLPSKHRVTEQ